MMKNNILILCVSGPFYLQAVKCIIAVSSQIIYDGIPYIFSYDILIAISTYFTRLNIILRLIHLADHILVIHNPQFLLSAGLYLFLCLYLYLFLNLILLSQFITHNLLTCLHPYFYRSAAFKEKTDYIGFSLDASQDAHGFSAEIGSLCRKSGAVNAFISVS